MRCRMIGWWRASVAALLPACLCFVLMHLRRWLTEPIHLILPTEFCERGSLTDVLQRASCDPGAAAELTWPRRLALVRESGWVGGWVWVGRSAWQAGCQIHSLDSQTLKRIASLHAATPSTPHSAFCSPKQAIDAAQGMLYLHNKGILHRDLKGPNLLVDQGWRARVRQGRGAAELA